MGNPISTSQPIPIAKMMGKLALVMTALLAVSSASPLGFGLGAPLLSKVTYGPAEVTKTIQPEVTVPYAAPYHTEPVVHHYPLPSTYSFDAVPALGFQGVPAVQRQTTTNHKQRPTT